MTQGLVSVIVPTHNYGAYLHAALDSILCQSYRPVEVVVVDDGSDDDTPQVMSAYCSNAGVRYVRQARAGAAAARNRGIEEATGEFIAFLDADDTWPEREMLAHGVAFLDANPSVGWMFGDAEPFNDDGVLDEPYLRKGGYYRGFSSDPEVRAVTPADLCNNERFFIPTGTILVRRTCIDAIGVFDTSLHMFEDTDMWLRLIRFPVAFVRQVLLARRVHDGNLSNRRWAYLPDLELLIARYALEEHGVCYAPHAARANYLAGRHWLEESDYDRACAAFREAWRHEVGWKTALCLAYASAGRCRQSMLARSPASGKARDAWISK